MRLLKLGARGRRRCELLPPVLAAQHSSTGKCNRGRLRVCVSVCVRASIQHAVLSGWGAQAGGQELQLLLVLAAQNSRGKGREAEAT
eukprot:1161421-Pelagomonas_calceolata.AAC.6